MLEHVLSNNHYSRNFGGYLRRTRTEVAGVKQMQTIGRLTSEGLMNEERWTGRSVILVTSNLDRTVLNTCMDRDGNMLDGRAWPQEMNLDTIGCTILLTNLYIAECDYSNRC